MTNREIKKYHQIFKVLFGALRGPARYRLILDATAAESIRGGTPDWWGRRSLQTRCE